ncbi:MAG TPA: response regulator transcription factor [Bacteroidia bacterium]|nr:response regulator transcription factor [Bacteroidia bacterium]
MGENRSAKIRILLAEDDENLSFMLEQYLIQKGYDVTVKSNGQDAFDVFCKKPFDLLILDVMMPKLDGFNLARKIREINQNVPIIFLTAKGSKEDTLEGFNAGGDDYITKPFSMDELIARINAILKRTNAFKAIESDQNVFEIGDYTFYYNEKELIHNPSKEKMSLTTKEADLLRLFAIHKNDLLDRSFALKSVWGDDNYYNSRSMDVYIAKLRKYLSKDENINIVNVHGKGFKLYVKS